MKIKDGVIFDPQIEMRKALIYTEQLLRGYGKQLIITSGKENTESGRGANSMHWYGYAYDFRTRELSVQESKEVSRHLQTYLGDMYKVIWKENHIHVELQPWAAALDKKERRHHVKYCKGPIN